VKTAISSALRVAFVKTAAMAVIQVICQLAPERNVDCVMLPTFVRIWLYRFGTGWLMAGNFRTGWSARCQRSDLLYGAVRYQSVVR
jgi:hypothetical protein